MKKFFFVLLAIIIAISITGLLTGCEGAGPPSPVTTSGITPGAEASSLIPTQNNTFDVGSLAKQWNDAWFGGTVTAATLSNTTGTISALTASSINASTLGTVSGSLAITASTAAITTMSGNPNFTGTPTFANHASGTSSFTGATTTKYIAHGMSSTPTRVFISWAANPGTSSSSSGSNFFSWAANSTNITITAAVATNATATLYWLAFIADE